MFQAGLKTIQGTCNSIATDQASRVKWLRVGRNANFCDKRAAGDNYAQGRERYLKEAKARCEEEKLVQKNARQSLD
jgi:hypothetical protein